MNQLGGVMHWATKHWWVGVSAVVVLAMVAMGVVVGLGDQKSGSNDTRVSASKPLTSNVPDGSLHDTAVTTAAVETIARSVPVRISIPAIHVSSSLSQLALNPDGTAEVPTNFAEAGWYRLGVSPGQLGSAVILGHVHGNAGPAVFWDLAKLKLKDHIKVELTDGATAEFEVTQLSAYKKADFPSQLVYGTHDYAGLNLVTCGGVYDKKNHRFLSSVVVYSTLVSTTKATI